jgi:ligand-binding sensor domain-containing protein/class 3 adenylate cyclase/predicted metal-dependent HD superfamily phosphohydrolase
MKRHIRWLIAGLLALTPFQQRAQDNIRFQNLDINKGLSQSTVNAVIQDEAGFIWIATQDGLNRFDGLNFKVFRNQPDNTNSLSNNYITSLSLDESGVIWVGTEGGLNRFDPRKESFERYLAAKGKANALPENKITDVLALSGGKTLVGMAGGGVAVLSGNTFTPVPLGDKGLVKVGVRSFFKDSRQRVWILSTAGVFVMESGETSARQVANAVDEAWCAAEDSQKRIWIGGTHGIVRLTPSGDLWLDEEIELGDGKTLGAGIRTLLIDGDNQLWIGTSGNGVYSMDAADDTPSLHHYRHQEFNPNSLLSDLVYDIFEDRAGVIWFGSKNGLSRFDRLRQGFAHIAQQFDTPNTMSDNSIWCFAEDKKRGIFFGNRKGITYWNRIAGTFTNYPRNATNPNTPGESSALSLWLDKDGKLWVGFVDGLFLFENGNYRKVVYRENEPDGADARVYALREDGYGRLWIGTREGLAVLDKRTMKAQFYQNEAENPKSLPENLIRSVFIDSQGDVWIGTDGGGLCKAVEKNNTLEFVRHPREEKADVLPVKTVLSIWEEKPGVLWLGTYGGGLVRYNYKTDVVSSFNSESHGLANDVIYGILADKNDNLWLSTNKGLCRFNIRNYTVRNFMQKDGLQSNEFNIGAYFTASTGEMFFGGLNGFNVFNPENIRTNNMAPRVAITDFVLDGKSYQIGPNSPFINAPAYLNDVVLRHTQNRFVIEFAALHYSDPEGNAYKYRLEGVDPDFMYTRGTDHRANYTNLQPGEYTFVVYGANGDGTWSDEPTRLRVVIESPYWKSDWFQGLMIILISGGAFYAFLRQVKEIRRQKLRLERQVIERTREVIRQKEMIEEQSELIKKEKEKVEKLLLNVLPEQTADELKSKGKAAARSYKRVSIMFTDFRNFTRLAEEFRPPELVARLDDYFSKFDEIISRYQLEKIKTIGDAYMCAGGVPVRNVENPIYTVLAALEIQQFMRQDKQRLIEQGESPWELRIGINTGEVVAGVIGSKRFAYDVWGNAVNVAARMETASEPGKVNVSGRTFELIEPYFECTYRGKIPAKNKGHIDMYFVERIKPELTANQDGITPSQAFWDYANLHLFSSINYMKAERYIMRLLEKKLSPKLHYHSIAHTRDVTKAAERIALMEGVKGEDLFLLQTAATYHDAGFVDQYEANEPVGVRMAREILPRYGYEEDQIDVVAGLIYATRIPHNPQNHLQEIICDADLDYLGRDDFHEIADKLRLELREHGKINSDKLWDEIQVKFLTQHRYFTRSAIKLRQEKKERHIEEIKARLLTGNYKD